MTTAALTALDFKNRFIAWQTARLQSDSDPYNDGVIPLLRLASIALNIVIVWAAVAVTLTNFGGWAAFAGDAASGHPVALCCKQAATVLSCLLPYSLHPETATGFHIGPLMASIGGVGVIVGFASQDLLANIASAVSLVSARGPCGPGQQRCAANRAPG